MPKCDKPVQSGGDERTYKVDKHLSTVVIELRGEVASKCVQLWTENSKNTL